MVIASGTGLGLTRWESYILGRENRNGQSGQLEAKRVKMSKLGEIGVLWS